MQNRPWRIAGVLSLGIGALTMTGASPATRPTERTLVCRVVNGQGEVASPQLTVVEGQDFAFIGGGEVLAPSNQYVDYGTRIAGSLSPSTGGAMLLDLTFSQTRLGQATPAIVIGGATVHTVRSVRLGEKVHLALGDAAGTTLDMTVKPA